MSKNKIARWIFVNLLFAGSVFFVSESVAETDARAALSVHMTTAHNREEEQHTAPNGVVSTTIEREVESCVLEIEVENPAERTGNYDVEWCVIAKRKTAKDPENLVISDAGKIGITREGGATGTETLKPRSLVFTITSKNFEDSDSSAMDEEYSQQTREGDTYAGYIVLVKADGQILAQDCNDDRFSTDEWAERCEKAALAKNKAKAALKK